MELAWKGGAMRRARLLSFINHHYSLFIIISSFLFITSLAACSSDSGEEQRPVAPTPEQPEVVDQRTAISFSGHEEEEKEVDAGSTKAHGANGAYGTRAVTRAGTPLSEKGVNAFKVWGYKNMEYTDGSYGDKQDVFPGYMVKWQNGSAASTTTNSSGWEYILPSPYNDQTIKYWDWAAKAYKFFGVTNWEAESAGPYEAYKSYGAPAANKYEISMMADATDADEMDKTPFFSHLWFSTDALPTYADKRYGNPVVLEFLKPYARVRYMLIFSYESEGIKIKSQSFKPTNGDKIVRKGTFTVSYPLTGTETRESFTVTPATGEGSGALTAFTQEYIPDGGPSKEIWYYVLPNNTQGSYTMTLLMNNDPAKTAVVPAEYMQWLPGYSYTYIFKILEEGGVEIELVQAAVTPWTEMEIDRTVYNW